MTTDEAPDVVADVEKALATYDEKMAAPRPEYVEQAGRWRQEATIIMERIQDHSYEWLHALVQRTKAAEAELELHRIRDAAGCTDESHLVAVTNLPIVESFCAALAAEHTRQHQLWIDDNRLLQSVCLELDALKSGQ